ncbi:RNA polymerase sigma factor [Sphingomonas sp. AP4-R1]|uniref:RNA polymerase sigma factor n=1 Tax=Sphingomonas sp. AP4-R1 TaxID=2735134 RepID=UPI0020A38A5B|nr:RNA polymerase sigma factor [Sphingomonas sp. AP4-R1]
MGEIERASDRGDDPDADLVRRIGQGDGQAAGTLVARKLPRLKALGARLLGDPQEAEDIAQEVFLRVWRHAAGWTPGAARFDTWMHRVALNLCYDRLRRRREAPLPEGWDAPDDRAGPDAGIETAGEQDRIAAALAALPDRQREAIVLTYYQELRNAEAAALMGIHVEALESLLSRGRRALRARLTEAGPNGDRR